MYLYLLQVYPDFFYQMADFYAQTIQLYIPGWVSYLQALPFRLFDDIASF